jgi:putative nucleotidyltransferase with HDIG domain
MSQGVIQLAKRQIALKQRRRGVAGVVIVSNDMTDRKEAEEKLESTLRTLRKAMGGTIQAIVQVVERRDPYTAGHQRRVADLARSIAAEMRLSRDMIEGVRMAAVIHDIGKISVPAEILSKPGKLTGIEFELIKEHARSGYEILKDVEFPWPIAEIIHQHHERLDGSGYPRGLSSRSILMEARIIALADVFEAIASHRPYRPALGVAVALDEIGRQSGILYDPDVTDACFRLFRTQGYSLVE